MALIWGFLPPHFLFLQRIPLSSRTFPPSLLSLPPPLSVALRATGAEGTTDPALLRRPLVSGPPSVVLDSAEESPKKGKNSQHQRERNKGKEEEEEEEEEEWVDWEDQILECTVPLVGFVKMLLHSGKYESGDRLIPEHEKTIMERLLPYHPDFEKKLGSGIDFITVGFHPEFENSRCLFIVRKDGELMDFSYWKCIKGLIKKKYPLYADSFIRRHFGRSKRTD